MRPQPKVPHSNFLLHLTISASDGDPLDPTSTQRNLEKEAIVILTFTPRPSRFLYSYMLPMELIGVPDVSFIFCKSG